MKTARPRVARRPPGATHAATLRSSLTAASAASVCRVQNKQKKLKINDAMLCDNRSLFSKCTGCP